ncbi:MAG: hypothetical protein HRT88_23660, partial [Lentisphaeraceae bacterium]|nr:hypothetical protein [Lentisphaeraceae bacterium]
MFITGQRWISEAEPELGLGTIINSSLREVHIHFNAAEVTRVYAAESAPLKRVHFRIGEKISNRNEVHIKIAEISEENGLFSYHEGNVTINEIDLADNLSFSEAQSRLLKQNLDDNSLFNLRHQCHRHNE